MSERENKKARAQEELALRAVQGMRLPAAPEDVRQRAERAFLDGILGDSQSTLPREAQGETEPSRITPLPRQRRVLRFAAPLAAAAALAFALLWGSRPANHWTVTDVVEREGVGLARGCGNPGERVYEGRIEVGPESEIELQLGQELRIRLLAGTVVDLPSGAGRLFGRTRTLRVISGEAYGTTGGRKLDFAMKLETDEAAATLTGTTFAVFRTEEATCYCLYQGDLDILVRATGEGVELPVGERVFLYRDGRPPHHEPLSAMEQMKLTMMDEGGMVNPLPQHP